MKHSEPKTVHCQRCGAELLPDSELPVCASCALRDAVEVGSPVADDGEEGWRKDANNAGSDFQSDELA
jgi:hypothetical protein